MKILKPLVWGLLAFLLLGFVSSIISLAPGVSHPSIAGLVTVWGLSFIISASSFVNKLRPNLVAKFMMFFNITNLFLAAAIHGLSTFLSGWFWIIALLTVYIFAWILPDINSRLAKYLFDTQLSVQQSPEKNRVSRLKLLLFFVGFGGLCSVLSVLGNKYWNVRSPSMLFSGVVGAFLAIGGGQAFAYQIWKERQKAHSVQRK